jgi:NADH-quinone oxidoreductase subunit L
MRIAALAILAPLVATGMILATRRVPAWLALVGAGSAALAAVTTLVRVADGARFAAALPGLPGLPLRLVVDPLASLFSTVVAVVALLVLAYAVGYMRGERDRVRFWAGMSFFAAAMQGVVLAGDWVLLLACWELIGLASYLLIGFWFARPMVGPAATRAFLTTRAADLGLYIGIFLLVARTGTTTIADTLHAGGATATVAGLLLLVAAMGKAAQAPFQGWLQDAMLGPTPVSALLHSATLVAAGAILLTRVFPLLHGGVLLVVGGGGGVTALVTGVTALAQRDLKRLLASSTSSQLGFMLLAIGAGSPIAAAIHLTVHAAMKSALFQGAGIFQHARDSTAFADLGGVGRAHRRVFTGFTIAGLALAGVPPLAGFWSKDTIVAATLASPNAWLLAPLALVGTLLTGGYVARALRLVWQGTGVDKPVAGAVWMGTGLAVLAALAALLGLAVRPMGDLLSLTIPESIASTTIALLAAAVGLLGGWFLPAARMLGPARPPAEVGFRVAGGFDALVVRPALALAALTARFDEAILGAVFAVGRGALGVARAADRADESNHAAVVGIGRAGLVLAALSRRTDAAGIDRAIAALVHGTRDLGAHARRLQSGFVSRELVLATSGAALLVVLLILLR